ncbi:MAG: hypothetical protein LBB54_04580 [Cellulomonadaceae bacterium]|jgi:TRAP-type C4-dicarboxylate transport system permease small subunit|nr:hypothetical protein [Cellulomonadaceae bacterium]
MGTLLTDALPVKARKFVYLVVALASLTVTAYQAANGSWLTAAASFTASLAAELARANAADDEGQADVNEAGEQSAPKC